MWAWIGIGALFVIAIIAVGSMLSYRDTRTRRRKRAVPEDVQ
jgi:hypothetical protein